MNAIVVVGATGGVVTVAMVLIPMIEQMEAKSTGCMVAGLRTVRLSWGGAYNVLLFLANNVCTDHTDDSGITEGFGNDVNPICVILVAWGAI